MNQETIKTVGDMSRKEIESVPYKDSNEDIGEFTALIILPLRKLHDSGYRLMDFVAVRNGIPLKRLSGCSDVLHINGIGGDGEYTGRFNPMVPAVGWSMDCLPKSGLLQLFSDGVLTVSGYALSSFEIYSKKVNNGSKS